MAAPTNPAYVKKALANLEPSTHGTSCHFLGAATSERYRAIADNAGLAVGSTRLRLTLKVHFLARDCSFRDSAVTIDTRNVPP
jgi:hypothetical protein